MHLKRIMNGDSPEGLRASGEESDDEEEAEGRHLRRAETDKRNIQIRLINQKNKK